MRYFAVVVIFIVLSLVKCDDNRTFSWYSTIGEMRNLTAIERDLLSTLERGIQEEKENVYKLQRKVSHMRKIGEEILAANDKTRGKISDFRLRDRFEKSWMDLHEISKFVINKTFQMKTQKNLDKFPKEHDMMAVVDVLLQLQISYKLNESEIAEGYILGKRAGRRMSTDACEYMAHTSCQKHWKTLCEGWVKITLARMDAGEDTQLTREDLNSHLVEMLNNELFKEVCAGSISTTMENSPPANLHCQMWDNFRHPWLILQPVQMEILSLSPDIVRFHNVISNKEIDHLKSVAEPKLGTAKTFDLEDKIEVDSVRVAHNCWLSKKNSSVLFQLDNFVSAITGLEVAKASEDLQIANYGIGGHYSPHTDYMDHSPEKELKSSNRKATFMFYLSDVEHGGATAFLYPKLAVKPIKGSAVFWHNLMPSGMPDERTAHGSCPVVLGDKWVANKWIWETKKEVCKPKEYIGRLH